MVRIRDPLHGTIVLDELEERLLDSRQMQRLRGVRQLAMAYLVYPGANHTRFEHSIGTLFLADRMCREIGLDGEKTGKVRCAALLHDIGHTAFSHEAEEVLKKKLGSHEEAGGRMIAKGELADMLSEKFRPGEIAGLCGTPEGGIITSDIGADRMDYLLRDSHYTGVAYGVIDSERICSTVRMARKGISLSEGGLEAAESLLVARFAMFTTVYLHKTVRIASRMLQEAITSAIGEGSLVASDAGWMTDAGMLSALLESRRGREYAARLKERRLFKKACSIQMERFLKAKIGKEKAEEELSGECGTQVLLDIPKLSSETSIIVESGGRSMPLSEASGLVSSLQSVQKSRLEALVICEEGAVGKVRKATERAF